MNNRVVWLVIFLKFFLPILFLRYPFPVSWINWLLDTTDGDILMHFGLQPFAYQTWDKLADWFTYLMMLLVGRKWRIRRTIVFLFIFRTVGQMVYFITRRDEVFFFFPNFLEPLFMLYSLLIFINRKQAYRRYRKYLLPFWTVIAAYKMWNEWNTHIAKNDLSQQWFGVNN